MVIHNYIVKFSKVHWCYYIHIQSVIPYIEACLFILGIFSYSEGVPTPSMMEAKPAPVSEKVSVAQIE